MCLYHPNQAHIFDMKRSMVAFAAFLVVASFFAFLIFEADNMAEYVNSAYFTTTLFGVFCSFIHTSTETATIFLLLDSDMGKIIDESTFEFQSSQIQCTTYRYHFQHLIFFEGWQYPGSAKIYIKTHGLVEKLCKIMYFVIVNVTVPGFILPKAFICFVVYFTTNSGSDAFELPLPIW